VARACERLGGDGATVNSASPATLSAAFFLRELVHTLMRQPKETSGIARAHLERSGSQDLHGRSSRSDCPSVFLVGLLAGSRVRPDRPCRGWWQLHVVDNGGRAGHRRRTVGAPLGCGAELHRRCDPACGRGGHRARKPPTGLTDLARRPRDRTSRLLQPTFQGPLRTRSAARGLRRGLAEAASLRLPRRRTRLQAAVDAA
jgi:hypothetical protein